MEERLRGGWSGQAMLLTGAYALCVGALTWWQGDHAGRPGALGFLLLPIALAAFRFPRQVLLVWGAIIVAASAGLAAFVWQSESKFVLGRLLLFEFAVVGVSLLIRAAVAKRDELLRAYRASEQRFRVLTDHALDLVSEVDVRGCFTYVSPNHQSVLGQAAESLIGTKLVDLVHPDDLAAVTARWGLIEDDSHPVEPLRVRVMHADGSWVWMSTKSQPYLREGGDMRFLCSSRDISHEMTVERELERYRQNLELLVEERTRELDASRERLRTSERLASLGTLAAGIAHQINNPIGAILTSTQFGLSAKGDADRIELWREILQQNEAQALRCGEIVHSLLRFARNEPVDKSVVDLNTVVAATCELTSVHLAKRGARLVLETSSESLPMLMSRIEMEQVLVNLLHNAAESDEGVEIRVETLRVGHRARVRVIDDGEGMSAQQRERIFDPFFTTKLKRGGTGLGLSVAHGIVCDHGGEIGVASEPGSGTTIEIDLPLANSGESCGSVAR